MQSLTEVNLVDYPLGLQSFSGQCTFGTNGKRIYNKPYDIVSGTTRYDQEAFFTMYGKWVPCRLRYNIERKTGLPTKILIVTPYGRAKFEIDSKGLPKKITTKSSSSLQDFANLPIPINVSQIIFPDALDPILQRQNSQFFRRGGLNPHYDGDVSDSRTISNSRGDSFYSDFSGEFERLFGLNGFEEQLIRVHMEAFKQVAQQMIPYIKKMYRLVESN